MSQTLEGPRTAPVQAAAAPRFDVYAGIHKAIRLFMTDTLTRLGCVDGADLAELRGAIDQLMALLALMRSHIEHEDQFIHPAMEARRAGSAEHAAAEHDEHRASIDALECEANAMTAAPAPQREALALRLYRHLALFVAENLQHMHAEETAHNAVLWAAYRDDELIALHDELLASVPPAEMAQVLHWMAPALAPAELTRMLGAMQTEVPPEAMRDVLARVQARLPQDRWARLALALRLPQAPGLVYFG